MSVLGMFSGKIQKNVGFSAAKYLSVQEKYIF
jgi:hypothetical protein